MQSRAESPRNAHRERKEAAANIFFADCGAKRPAPVYGLSEV